MDGALTSGPKGSSTLPSTPRTAKSDITDESQKVRLTWAPWGAKIGLPLEKALDQFQAPEFLRLMQDRGHRFRNALRPYPQVCQRSCPE